MHTVSRPTVPFMSIIFNRYLLYGYIDKEDREEGTGGCSVLQFMMIGISKEHRGVATGELWPVAFKEETQGREVLINQFGVVMASELFQFIIRTDPGRYIGDKI